MPHIRLATDKDYHDIWTIWMSDHVLPYMSFPYMDEVAFRTLYDTFARDSQIYVMVDVIDGKEKIVAVRRMQQGREHSSHIMGWYSFGVHPEYLGRGYGQKFYEALLAIIAKKPEIKRIEFTQSFGNSRAFHLADKAGFKVEACFPEWLYRQKPDKSGRYNLSERFVYLLTDPKIAKKIIKQDLNFAPLVPQLTDDYRHGVNYLITRGRDNLFTCLNAVGKTLGFCRLTPGPRVISHIAFLDIFIKSEEDADLMVACLRKISLTLKAEGFKKIEITTPYPLVVELLQYLGFHHRGEKVASFQHRELYYNEACADFSFFDIQDAKDLLATVDVEEESEILRALGGCSAEISSALGEKQIDQYMAIYCENMAFQMLRESLGECRLYNPDNLPWKSLIESLPNVLQLMFENLAQALEEAAVQLTAEEHSAKAFRY